MCATLALIAFFFVLITPSLQIDIAFSNPLHEDEYVQQICTDIPLHVCCVPMDILIPDKGWGWFRAERVVFTNTPQRPMSAAVWKYEVKTRHTNCRGVSAGAFKTENGLEGSYGYAPSEARPGLSGGRIAEWGPDQTGDDNLGTTPRGVAYPNIVRYLGDSYFDDKLGNGVYISFTAKVIRGIPLWRKSITFSRWGLVTRF